MKRLFCTFFFKVTLSICLFLLSISVQAQKEIDLAKNYLTQNTATQKLSASDINEMIVSSAYLSPTTGWYHLYFNQTYESIEVYNGLLNLTLKQDQVINTVHTFVQNIADKAVYKPATVSPLQALQNAAQSVNLTASSADQITEIKSALLPNGTVGKTSFLDNNLSNENIEVKLYWLPYEGQEGEKTVQKIALTWNVRFMTKDNQNSWNIHVDALSGGVLEKRDDVIHCNFGAPHQHTAAGVCAMGMLPQARQAAAATLAANSYNVFDYPLESPNHGGRTVVSNPYTRFVPTGTGPGTTNGWHNDGTNDYTTTRGNNVWAKEDLAADNENTIGASPVSATLDFNYPYVAGDNVTSRDAAITNLFYWNNLIHDVLWKYGFDEPSGNFQNNNLGRGGAGNDFVFADAQDGSGTNNANFNTPVDGGNGRMQMFLWNIGAPPNTDSDFDNGVIAHEYGHGWSIRLTGGPANSSCLQNAEQGGEGWSDYLALMLTTPWSTLTPTVTSANIPRGIGTYVFNQPTTGAGIRPYRYSYDMANINAPVTYAKVGDAVNFSQPHGIGSIWATMLWDMTWEIILQDNFIDLNIYNTPANILDMKGNVAALKLVNEGLRLQPCSPSFVQARDAILLADQQLFGGRYRCAIGRAFARRGLGLYASTGASTDDRTVTEDFTPISGPGLSSPLSVSVCGNQPFNYTATVGVSGTYTYNWTRAAVSGISNAAGSGTSAAVNETLINTTTGAVTVKYVFTVSPDACGGTPSPQTVTVVVNPSVTPTVGTYTICQNATVPQGEGLVAPPAFGNKVSGTLTNASPTYNRGNGNNTTTYTASGTNVYYQTFTFVSPINGNVTFETINPNLINSQFGPTDTYLTLYQTSFNAATPATNFLRGDDDSGVVNASLLTHPLVQGATYVLVVTTFTNGATGTFSLQASVPGFTGTNNWYKNASGGAPLATGEIFNPVGVAGSDIPNTATPGTTTFYVATEAFPDCRTPVTFTINPNHTINLTSNAATETQIVCVDSPITPITYALGGGATGANVTGLPMGVTSSVNSGVLTISGTPTVTVGSPFSYNITTTGNACTVATESGSITVNALPTPSISVTETSGTTNNDGTICNGASVTLTASGGGTYLWNTGAMTAAITVAPSSTTPYSITFTNANGCSATANTTVTVNALPTPNISVTETSGTTTNDGTICNGASVTLTASGGGSYLWNTGAMTAAITVAPSSTTPYSVTVTNANGCSATANSTITVNALPNPNISITETSGTTNNDGTICNGASVTLTATAGASYLWNTGAMTAAITVAPSSTTPYSVTVTDANGCSATANSTVTVNALPTVAITGLNAAYCKNNASVTLTGTPAGGSFTIDNVAATSFDPAALTVGPHSVVYTYTDGNSCTNTATQSVIVNALPTLFNVTGGGPYCSGGVPNSIGLSESQTGINYQLFREAVPVGSPVAGTTGSPITFGPQATAGTYTVVATNATTLCKQVMTGSVTVSTFSCTPTISDPCTCLNNATTLTDGQFGETVQVNAPTGQTWTVTAVTGLYTITSPVPPAAPIPILVGATMTESPAGVYKLVGKHIDAVGYTISVSNGLGTTLSIGNSCQYPNPVITNLAPVICSSTTPITLMGNPGDANTISQSFTVNGVGATQFIPSTPGNYTIAYTVNGGVPKATGPNDPGCTQTVSQSVTVNPTPNAVAMPTAQTICTGSAITPILLSGAVSGTVYNWTRDNGALGSGTVTGIAANGSGNISGSLVNTTGAPVTVTFTITPTYTNAGQTCSGSPITATVMVNPLPTAIVSGTTQVCQNAPFPTITFTGSNGTAPYTFTYKINGGPDQTITTTSGNSVSLNQTTAAAGTFVYSLVSVKDASSTQCSQSQSGSATITVNPLPVLTFTGPNPVCQGLNSALSANLPGTWTANDPSKATIAPDGTINALQAGTATFTFTVAGTGCQATTSPLTIKPTPTSALTASKYDVCPNTEVTLNPNCSIPTSTVQWNPGAPTVTPAAATLPYVYKARCVADGCVGNETSVEVRTHRILVDMKDLDVGTLPLPIVRSVIDNMAPTNQVNAPVFPRRWTFIANGCNASESAVFKLSGPVNFSAIDNAGTYALFANDGLNGNLFYSIDHPNYGNGGSFPNGTYTLTIDLRSQDGVGGPFPKNRVAVGSLLATRTLQFTVGNASFAGREGAENLNTSNEENWINILQNPVNEEIAIQLSGKVDDEIQLSLTNSQGQSNHERSLKLVSSQQHEIINVRSVPAGLYILKAIKGANIKTFKVIKVD